MQVADDEVRVVLALGEDVRDAERVAENLTGPLEPGAPRRSALGLCPSDAPGSASAAASMTSASLVLLSMELFSSPSNRGPDGAGGDSFTEASGFRE